MIEIYIDTQRIKVSYRGIKPEYIQLNILCIKRELSFIFSAGTKNDKNKLVQVIQDDIR